MSISREQIEALREDVGREPSPIADQIEQAISDTPKYSPVAAFYELVREAVEVVMRAPVQRVQIAEGDTVTLEGFGVGADGAYHHFDVDRQLLSSPATREIYEASAEANQRGPTGIQRVRVVDRGGERHGKSVLEFPVTRPWTHAKVIEAVLNSWPHGCYFCYWSPTSWVCVEADERRLKPRRVGDALLVTTGTTVVGLPVCSGCHYDLRADTASNRPEAMDLHFLSTIRHPQTSS